MVLVLSLFCSFFCPVSVHAEPPRITSNGSSVYFNSVSQEKSNYVTVSSFYAFDLIPGKWYTLTLGYSATYTISGGNLGSVRINDFTVNTGGDVFYGDCGAAYYGDYSNYTQPINTGTFTFKATSTKQYIYLRARYSASLASFFTGYKSGSLNMYLYVNSSSIDLAADQPGSDLATYDDVQSIVGNATLEINNKLQETGDTLHDDLTNFPGASGMDTSKGDLDSAISDYDQIEGSLFDSGQAAFDQFDPSSLLDFSAGIFSAIGNISQLMVSIISAMGEFSVIYTVGTVLVFIGMLFGLWRFFK